MSRALVATLQSSTLRCPDWLTLERDPVSGTQTGWATPIVNALAVGPIDLYAGDVIQAHLHHELDNENDGAGFWTINGVKSEHWFLWAMASTAVRVGQAVNPNAGAYVVPPQETNWDWLIHHLGVSRSDLYVVPADMPGAYVYDRVYFKSGMAYTRPEAQYRRIQINRAPYARLSVAVFR